MVVVVVASHGAVHIWFVCVVVYDIVVGVCVIETGRLLTISSV